MSRNRLKHSHSLQWATVLKWLIVVGFLAVLGMSYVWKKNQILRLASDVRDLEVEQDNWKKRNYQLELNINRLTSQAMLQRTIADANLGFVKIGELDVVPMERGVAGAQVGGTRYSSPVAYNVSNVNGGRSP